MRSRAVTLITSLSRPFSMLARLPMSKRSGRRSRRRTASHGYPRGKCGVGRPGGVVGRSVPRGCAHGGGRDRNHARSRADAGHSCGWGGGWGEGCVVVGGGVEGEIGIMPGHEPMLAILAAGEVRLTLPGGKKIEASAGDGLLSVQANHVQIVASRAALA